MKFELREKKRRRCCRSKPCTLQKSGWTRQSDGKHRWTQKGTHTHITCVYGDGNGGKFVERTYSKTGIARRFSLPGVNFLFLFSFILSPFHIPLIFRVAWVLIFTRNIVDCLLSIYEDDFSFCLSSAFPFSQVSFSRCVIAIRTATDGGYGNKT